MGQVLAPLAAAEHEAEASRSGATPSRRHRYADLLRRSASVPSAQVKSAVLLASLHAPGRHGDRTLGDARPHRAHAGGFFGAELVGDERGEGARAVTVCGDAELHGASIAVPGDPSSAAFLIAAALIAPGSDINRRGRAAQSDAKRLHRNSARDGREHRDTRPPRRRRRACRRSSRAVERAESRARAPRTGTVDDRRISDPRLSCRLRRGRNRDGGARRVEG